MSSFEAKPGEVVSFEYPIEDGRPVMRPTFMWVGVAVLWSSAPVTSEDIDLFLISDSDLGEQRTLLHSIDPSDESATDWVHIIGDGPIPLPVGF